MRVRGTSGEDGPLLAADESLAHQIVETHAHVAQADPSWTEKVCAMAAATDGSLQLGFGIGRYPNRNVFDGYGGVSRGREQWTVRASRRLSDDPDAAVAGPLHYEVAVPFRRVRFRCEATEVVPVSFDWTFEAVVPPVLERRDRQRARRGFRLDVDVLRYHQVGVASGWARVGDRHYDITPDTWISTRDHSWGIRQDVGPPPAAGPAPTAGPSPTAGPLPARRPPGAFRFSWSPMLLTRTDGTRYGLHHQYRAARHPGGESVTFEGTVEEADGRVEPLAAMRPALRFDPANRRLLGGVLHFVTVDARPRPVTVEPVSDTGFHLGLGLYFGLDGHHHGEWRGPHHVEGEHVADCTDATVARRIHQLRDTVVRVDDPVGGGRGWGNLQTTIVGAWPEEGLDEESSFL